MMGYSISVQDEKIVLLQSSKNRSQIGEVWKLTAIKILFLILKSCFHKHFLVAGLTPGLARLDMDLWRSGIQYVLTATHNDWRISFEITQISIQKISEIFKNSNNSRIGSRADVRIIKLGYESMKIGNFNVI